MVQLRFWNETPEAEKLVDACECGDLKTVQEIYQTGNVITKYFEQAMYTVAMNGHVDILKYLDSKGIPIYIKIGDDILLRAAQKGQDGCYYPEFYYPGSCILTKAIQSKETLMYLIENCGLYDAIQHVPFPDEEYRISSGLINAHIHLRKYAKQTEEKELEQVCRQNGIPKELNRMINAYL